MNNRERESIEALRQGRGDSSVAFMEFADKKQFFQDYVFGFYEGEDGKYYNQRIKSIVGQKFIHIKAGSKSKVLKVMHLIQSKKEYCKVKTMFFVDRDMGFDMEEYKNDDLYVTPCYSIENLYVNEESIGEILENEFGLNIGDNDYQKYKNKFNEYYKKFCDLMIEFNALVFLRKEKELDCEKVRINNIKTKRIIKIDISFGVSLGSDYHKAIDDLKQKLDVTDQDIEEAKTRLLKHGNPCDIFRGKNQLDFFVEYIAQLCKYKESLFEKKLTSVNINPNQNTLSTLSSYAKTPSDLTDFIKKHCLVKSAAIPC